MDSERFGGFGIHRLWVIGTIKGICSRALCRCGALGDVGVEVVKIKLVMFRAALGLSKGSTGVYEFYQGFPGVSCNRGYLTQVSLPQ